MVGDYGFDVKMVIINNLDVSFEELRVLKWY